MLRANKELIQAGREQGITIAPSLVEWLSHTAIGTQATGLGAPTLVTDAENLRANIVSGSSPRPYVDRPFDLRAIHDPLVRHYASLLNVSSGNEETRSSAFTAPAAPRYNYSLCAETEGDWARTIAVAHPSVKESERHNAYLQIIVDDETGEPQFLRKGRGAHPVGTALVDFSVTTAAGRRLVYPRGSIVLIETADDPELLKDTTPELHKLYFSNGSHAICSSSRITGLEQGRLSPLLYDNLNDQLEQFPGYAPSLGIDRPLARLTELAYHLLKLS